MHLVILTLFVHLPLKHYFHKRAYNFATRNCRSSELFSQEAFFDNKSHIHVNNDKKGYNKAKYKQNSRFLLAFIEGNIQQRTCPMKSTIFRIIRRKK